MPGPIIGRVRVLRIQLAGSTSLILAVLLAAAVGPVESNAKPTGRAAAAIQSGIYVQGDSLTVDSGPYLKQFASPSTVTVDARIGRHAYQGVALIRKKLPGLPGAVVVALGTNDDYDSVGVSLFRTHVNSIMGMLGAKRCVIWTTLYQKPKPAKRGKPRPPMVFTELNAVIDQTAKAWPNVRRVPWAEMAAANPDWFKYDSVHPTDAGYVARAKATVAALKRCPPWAGWPDKDDGSGGATPGT